MRLILLILSLWAGPLWADGSRVAFFGFHLLGVPTEAEVARGVMIEDAVRARFAEEGYELVDLAPVQEDLDRVVNPANCYGCDTRMGQKLGVDFVLVGEVQKVSEALIGLHLQMRDAATGDIAKVGVVNVRGNTDDTWKRGIRSILNNRFFRE